MISLRNRSAPFVVSIAVLLAGAGGLNAALRFMDIHLQKLPIDGREVFHSLPKETDSWRQLGADPPPLSAEVIEQLGTENYVSRRYVEKDPPEGMEPRYFELHCAYYTGMIDTVPHVPERCFVGGGMTIDGAAGAVVPIPIDLSLFPIDPTVPESLGGGEVRRGRTTLTSTRPGDRVRMPTNLDDLSLNVSVFNDPSGATLYAGYFFIANGAVAPRAENVRLLAFRHEDRYAYYAKVQLTSANVASPQELANMAADFLNEMLPDIMLRTPDWVDITEEQQRSAAHSRNPTENESES